MIVAVGDILQARDHPQASVDFPQPEAPQARKIMVAM